MTNPSRSRSHGREAPCGSSFRVLNAFIAAKAPIPIVTMDASEPPARNTSASPNLISRHDSPMALFDVAQAVTMQRLGPFNPNSIEIKPLAMLLINMGMVKGEMREGPLLSKAAC